MITNLLIALADFPDYVPFSVNIAPALVNPHIRDAQTFDVGPVLPEALRAVLAAPVSTWPAPADATAFYTNDVFAPPAGLQGLETLLFTDFVKPLLVCESARRMLLWHGAHVTPNGLETISDVGHLPVSGAQRAELRNDLASKCAYYRAKLETALRLAYPPAAGSCSSHRRRPGHGGLTTSAV